MGVNRGSLLHPTVTGVHTSLLVSKEQAARQILTHKNCIAASPYLFGGFLLGGICSGAVGKRKQVELATIFHHRVYLTQRNYQV